MPEAQSNDLPTGTAPMTLMKLLRQYHYDPLDRLTGETSAGRSTQRFYQEDDLVTEMGDQGQLTILRQGEEPLAQHRTVSGVDDTMLLATDRAHSVLQTLAGTNRQQMVYTAYGHRTGESGLSSLLGFNGEARDAITGHYLLGQGTRAFNPVLMRFNSPDELSPFDSGGINPYAYCGGDPINRYDPTGKIWQWIRFLGFRHYDAGMNLINNKVPVIVGPKSSPVFSNPSSIIEPTTASIARTPSLTISTPPSTGSSSALYKPKNSPFAPRDEQTSEWHRPRLKDESDPRKIKERERYRQTKNNRTKIAHEFDLLRKKGKINNFRPSYERLERYNSDTMALSNYKNSGQSNDAERRKLRARVNVSRKLAKSDVVHQYRLSRNQEIRT
jgi:RHS repeat-associated protein